MLACIPVFQRKTGALSERHCPALDPRQGTPVDALAIGPPSDAVQLAIAIPRRSSSRRLATSANGTRGRPTAPATLAISEPDRCTPLTPHPGLGLPPAGALCPSPPTQLPQQQAHFPVFYRPSPARSPVLLPHAPLPASSTEALCRPRRIPNLLPPQALFPLFGQLKTILSPLTKSPPIAAVSPAHPLQSPYRLVPR